MHIILCINCYPKLCIFIIIVIRFLRGFFRSCKISLGMAQAVEIQGSFLWILDVYGFTKFPLFFITFSIASGSKLTNSRTIGVGWSCISARVLTRNQFVFSLDPSSNLLKDVGSEFFSSVQFHRTSFAVTLY